MKTTKHENGRAWIDWIGRHEPVFLWWPVRALVHGFFNFGSYIEILSIFDDGAISNIDYVLIIWAGKKCWESRNCGFGLPSWLMASSAVSSHHISFEQSARRGCFWRNCHGEKVYGNIMEYTYIHGRDRIGRVSKRTTLRYHFLEAHFGTLRCLTLLT